MKAPERTLTSVQQVRGGFLALLEVLRDAFDRVPHATPGDVFAAAKRFEELLALAEADARAAVELAVLEGAAARAQDDRKPEYDDPSIKVAEESAGAPVEPVGEVISLGRPGDLTNDVCPACGSCARIRNVTVFPPQAAETTTLNRQCTRCRHFFRVQP